jgi:archaellum component FlaF (FlaF/FlaG flagellin family)
MKKLMYAAMFVLGTLSFSACDSSTSSTTEADEKVVDRDTVSTEVEVQETVVETDTSTRTRTVETDTTKR